MNFSYIFFYFLYMWPECGGDCGDCCETQDGQVCTETAGSTLQVSSFTCLSWTESFDTDYPALTSHASTVVTSAGITTWVTTYPTLPRILTGITHSWTKYSQLCDGLILSVWPWYLHQGPLGGPCLHTLLSVDSRSLVLSLLILFYAAIFNYYRYSYSTIFRRTFSI